MLAIHGNVAFESCLGVQRKQQAARFIGTSLSKLNQTLSDTEVHEEEVTS